MCAHVGQSGVGSKKSGTKCFQFVAFLLCEWAGNGRGFSMPPNYSHTWGWEMVVSILETPVWGKNFPRMCFSLIVVRWRFHCSRVENIFPRFNG